MGEIYIYIYIMFLTIASNKNIYVSNYKKYITRMKIT